MSMAVPMFFLFAVYGVVSSCMPLILRGMGYSVTQVGMLLGIFEVAGVVFPLLIGPLVERRGNYSIPLFILGCVMVVMPIPIVKCGGFWVSALSLSLYALGYKGAVPLSDSVASRLLGERRADYGKVRVAGSIGFVLMTLALQFFSSSDGTGSYLFWLVAPAVLFTLSLLVVLEHTMFRNSSATEVMERSAATSSRTVLDCGDNSSKQVSMGVAGFSKKYWMGLLLVFLGFMGLTPATKLFSLYVSEFLHSEAAPALWALSATSEIPFMFCSGRVLKKYGSMALLVFCTGMVALRMVLYMAVPGMAGAILGQSLNSITYGLYHPAAVLFVTENAPSGRLVTSMSMYSVLAVGLANVLGNSLGGLMIDGFGYPATFLSFAVLPFAGVVLYILVRKKI